MNIELQEYTDRAQSKHAKQWVQTVVRKQMAEPERASRDDIEHVIDWINSDEGPKTTRGLSWEHAVMHSQAWTIAINKRNSLIAETEEDTQVVLQVGNGLRWVLLLTERAYKREGVQMGHCIGNGGYFQKNTENYSLRDVVGKSHATLEVTKKGDKILQLQGKSNKGIHPKYIQAVLAMHEHIKAPMTPHLLSKLGYMPLSASLWSRVERLYPSSKFLLLHGEKYIYTHDL